MAMADKKLDRDTQSGILINLNERLENGDPFVIVSIDRNNSKVDIEVSCNSSEDLTDMAMYGLLNDQKMVNALNEAAAKINFHRELNK